MTRLLACFEPDAGPDLQALDVMGADRHRPPGFQSPDPRHLSGQVMVPVPQALTLVATVLLAARR